MPLNDALILGFGVAALLLVVFSLGYSARSVTVNIKFQHKEEVVKASGQITVVILPAPLAVPAQNLSGQTGQPFSGSVQANGGTPPDTFALDGTGTVPPGLTLMDDGSLQGTPTDAGSFTFGVVVTDSQG